MAPESRTPATESDPPAEEGGDAPCWMARVCPECGRLADEDPPTRCPDCQAAIGPS